MREITKKQLEFILDMFGSYKNAKNTITEKVLCDEVYGALSSNFDRYFGKCSEYLNTIFPDELKIDEKDTRNFSKIGYELMQEINSLIWKQKYYENHKEELTKSDYIMRAEGLGIHRGEFFNVKFMVRNDTVLYTELAKE